MRIREDTEAEVGEVIVATGEVVIVTTEIMATKDTNAMTIMDRGDVTEEVTEVTMGVVGVVVVEEATMIGEDLVGHTIQE